MTNDHALFPWHLGCAVWSKIGIWFNFTSQQNTNTNTNFYFVFVFVFIYIFILYLYCMVQVWDLIDFSHILPTRTLSDECLWWSCMIGSNKGNFWPPFSKWVIIVCDKKWEVMLVMYNGMLWTPQKVPHTKKCRGNACHIMVCYEHPWWYCAISAEVMLHIYNGVLWTPLMVLCDKCRDNATHPWWHHKIRRQK